MIWIVILLILIIIIAAVLQNRMAALNMKPTIWKEYTQYLVSGQRQRIPFDTALAAWRRDRARFMRRNAKIPPIKTCPRICTWNVHTWRKADGQNVAAEQIKSELGIINADILCLQEYTPRDDIDAVLDNMYPHKFIQTIGSMNFGNAIYSMKPITNTRVINLPVDPEVNEPRICLVARTYSMWIMNAHLEVRNSYPHVHKYRYPQIDTILDDVIGITDDAGADIGIADVSSVLIVGDLNVGNKSKIDRSFHEHIAEAGWCSANRGVDANTGNLIHGSNMYGGFVDHIYYQPQVLGTIGVYEYFTDSSDHYPVIADVFRKHFIKNESDINI